MKHLLKILIGSCMIVALVAFFPKTAAASGAASNILRGATATSEDDVWTVGESLNGVGSQTLIEHWNGSTWKVVPSPNPAGAISSFLNSVSVVSEDDAWAVGNSFDSSNTVLTLNEQTLIEHWDGSAWAVVPSSTPVHGVLNGIAAVSKTSVWAVGDYVNSAGSELTLTEHWNGSAWSIISSPNPAGA